MLKTKQYAFSAIGDRDGITANEYGILKAISKGQALVLASDLFLKARDYRAMAVDVTEIPGLTDRVNESLNLAVLNGGIEGDRHKAWVIDGMVRALAGEEYDRIVAESCNGEDGPNTYEWDTGISP